MGAFRAALMHGPPRLRVLRDNVSESVPRAAPATATTEAEQKPDEQAEPIFQDIVTGTPSTDPWQFRPYAYERSSATWQVAAQRRHQHRRRTNTLLGVAAVDLSGPHEPTPMIGAKVGQRPGHYFVVLTISAHDGMGSAEKGS